MKRGQERRKEQLERKENVTDKQHEPADFNILSMQQMIMLFLAEKVPFYPSHAQTHTLQRPLIQIVSEACRQHTQTALFSLAFIHIGKVIRYQKDKIKVPEALRVFKYIIHLRIKVDDLKDLQIM